MQYKIKSENYKIIDISEAIRILIDTQLTKSISKYQRENSSFDLFEVKTIELKNQFIMVKQ